MLRKIVNLLMGSPVEGAGRTHFEVLLDEVKGPVKDGLEKSLGDPLEILAQSVMAVVLEGDERVDPQAARAYFSVLVENERLPYGEQLDENELELLMALLLDYFSGHESVRTRANDVLALIERKFSQGAFSQARILLQIFETDNETRLNNERNLFYEDMIMRLGIRRRHEVPREERDTIRKRFSSASIVRDGELKSLVDWLGKHYYTHLCFCLRDPLQIKEWERLAEGEARERLLRYVPPERWRRPGDVEELSVLEQSRRFITKSKLKAHILRLIKMSYFLLLASGDTGFEEYIYSFTKWSKDFLEVDPLRILPMLHRKSVLEEEGLNDALEAIYDAELRERVEAKVDLSERKLKAAWLKFFAAFSQLDVNEIPPGHYDLSGFLLDHVLSFKQPEPGFGFKLYRLT